MSVSYIQKHNLKVVYGSAMKTSAHYTVQIFTAANFSTVTLLVAATAERCYSCSICESVTAILCLPTPSDLPPVIFCFLYLTEQSGFTWAPSSI